jgi:hypothetical protein
MIINNKNMIYNIKIGFMFFYLINKNKYNLKIILKLKVKNIKK